MGELGLGIRLAAHNSMALSEVITKAHECLNVNNISVYRMYLNIFAVYQLEILLLFAFNSEWNFPLIVMFVKDLPIAALYFKKSLQYMINLKS
jgi:hypothetical protein